MTDTESPFRRWIEDLANPDSLWEYGNGVPLAPDAKSFLAEFDGLRVENADMDGRLTAIEAQNELYEEQAGRLKARVVELEEEVSDLEQINAAFRDEDETMKLGELVRSRWRNIKNLEGRTAELRARVEELERHNKSLRLLGDGSYILLVEQIDAAVGFATEECEDPHDYHVAWEALNHLNIHRCTCNNGMYTEGNDDGSQTQDRVCELCNGRGWLVKGDQNEET
jgi:cell division protein FtsB